MNFLNENDTFITRNKIIFKSALVLKTHPAGYDLNSLIIFEKMALKKVDPERCQNTIFYDYEKYLVL